MKNEMKAILITTGITTVLLLLVLIFARYPTAGKYILITLGCILFIVQMCRIYYHTVDLLEENEKNNPKKNNK